MRKGPGLIFMIPMVILALLAILAILQWAGFLPWSNEWKNREYCTENDMTYAGDDYCIKEYTHELASGAITTNKEKIRIPYKK